MLSDFWHTSVAAGVSLLVGMILFALYVRTLVVRLSDAIEKLKPQTRRSAASG